MQTNERQHHVICEYCVQVTAPAPTWCSRPNELRQFQPKHPNRHSAPRRVDPAEQRNPEQHQICSQCNTHALCTCHGGTPSSGVGSACVARHRRRTNTTTRIATPNEKCRLIRVVAGVLRPICGMVHANTNCATSSAP